MTTFDLPTASTTADATLDRLRTGAPLSPLERLGLAELLTTVRSCRAMAMATGQDDYPVRSGLLLNVADVYDREFGAVSSDTKGDGTDD